MPSAILKRANSSGLKSMIGSWRSYVQVGTPKIQVGSDVIKTVLSAAPETTLQKARTWDMGVASRFYATPIKDVLEGQKIVMFGLPGAFTGICSQQHVPTYMNNINKFKAKGVDAVICVAINDPYTMNAWAEKLGAKDTIDFWSDFDGSFIKSLGLDIDLSTGLLGVRSQRWSAYIDSGIVKAFNLEKVPAEVVVSSAEVILEQI